MLKNQMQHATGILKSYRQNSKQVVYGGKSQISHLVCTESGICWRIPLATNRLDAKVRHCYPRGSAWERMVKLHSFEFMANN